MADEVSFNITGNAASLIEAVSRAGDQLENLTARLTDTQKATSSLAQETNAHAKAAATSSARTLDLQTNFRDFAAAATAAWVSTKAVVAQVSSWVDSATAQEDATVRLTGALRAAGTFTPQLVDHFSALASQFASTTVHSDELLLEMTALFTQIGGVGVDGMGQALTAATDLAAGLRIDLRTAVMMISQALDGNTGRLKRYGIDIDKARLQTEGASVVFGAIAEKMGGQAAAQIETFSGRMAQAGNVVDNTKESFGAFVTGAADPLLRAFLGLPDPIQKGGVALGLAGGFASSATASFISLAASLGTIAAALGVTFPAAMTTTGTMLAGMLIPAFKAAGVVALALGTALAGFKFGEWLGGLQIYAGGLGDTAEDTATLSELSEELFGRLMGLSSAQIEAGRAARTHAEMLKELDAAFRTASLDGSGLVQTLDEQRKALERGHDAKAAAIKEWDRLRGAEEAAGLSASQVSAIEKDLAQKLDDATAATKKAAAETERLGSIRDAAFGLDTTKRVEEMIRVIGGLPGVTKMSAEAQGALNAEVATAIGVYERLGKSVPDVWRRVLAATDQFSAANQQALTEAFSSTAAIQQLERVFGQLSASQKSNSIVVRELLEKYEALRAKAGTDVSPALEALFRSTGTLTRTTFDLSTIITGTTGSIERYVGAVKDANLALQGLDSSGRILSDGMRNIELAMEASAVATTILNEHVSETPGFFGRLLEAGKTNLSGLNAIFQAAFTGGGGIGGAIKSFATQAVSDILAMIPVIGPILSQFGGAIVAMFTKMGTAIKSLFGGPSGTEVAGRQAADNFRKSIDSMLTDVQRLEAGNDKWKTSVVGIRDAYLLVGRTEAEAMSMTQALWAAEKRGPEAVAAVIRDISVALTGSYLPAEQAAHALSTVGWQGVIDLIKQAQAETKKAGEETAAMGRVAQGSLASLTDSLDIMQAKIANTRSLDILREQFALVAKGGKFDISTILAEVKRLQESLGNTDAIMALRAALEEAARSGVFDIGAISAALDDLRANAAEGISIPIFSNPGSRGDSDSSSSSDSGSSDGYLTPGESASRGLKWKPKSDFSWSDSEYRAHRDEDESERNRQREEGVPGFATGGFIKPFENVLAMLHGGPQGEIVAPLDKLEAAFRGAQESAAPHFVEQHIHLNVGGRELAHVIAPELPSVLRALGVA